jgi:hypothetical protein
MPTFNIKFEGFEHETVRLVVDIADDITAMEFDHAPESWRHYQDQLRTEQHTRGNDQ